MFENLNSASENGMDSAKKYAEFTLKYARLKFFQKLTVATTVLAKLILIGLLILLGIVFLAVSCAITLSEIFDSSIYGFLATAGIFFTIAFIVFLLRGIINKAILKQMSKLFFEEKTA